MDVRDCLYIDGQWTKPHGRNSIDVVNPATEQIIGAVPAGNIDDINDAVSASKTAFLTWSKSPLADRIQILNGLSTIFKQRTDEIAELITSEVGTPLGFSRMAMVGTPRVVSRSYAKILENFSFEEQVYNSLVIKEPVGVCALITPWNYPLHQIIGKVAPAIAAGCTMILKPSKEAPLNAFLLAEILDELGLPSGVFNLVSGHGSDIGDALAKHQDVDMVSFTGSTVAGVKVSKSAAPTIKRVTLELGGKSANVVLDEGSAIRAAKSSISACFSNSGQTCSALTRLIIPAGCRDEVIEIVTQRVNGYRAGDPMDENTKCGPMISARQQEIVTEYIQSGIDEGANLIAGGLGMPDGLEKGFYVRPTAFADVSSDMRIWREEIFGPVLVISTYESEEEALTLANDSHYGLSGCVWSEDEEIALNFARGMRTGQVSINGGPFNISAPFGGYKMSGNGRELGVHGLTEFLELKSIQM